MPIRIRRREFIVTLGGAAAWPLAARAQQTRTVPVVGVLWHAGSAEEEGPYFRALMQGFRDLGYIDGRNIKLEHRFPNEMPERFRGMAAELVSLNVDVLVSVGNVASPYAKDATTTIPVVFTLVADPVGMKLVESFARPGANVTGTSTYSSEVIGRRLQLLKETVPGLSRFAQFVNPNAQSSRFHIDMTRAAAEELHAPQKKCSPASRLSRRNVGRLRVRRLPEPSCGQASATHTANGYFSSERCVSDQLLREPQP
jgi:putative ABC transport system substrate-binding protein